MSTYMAVPGSAGDTRSPHYQDLKSKVHQELLNRLNLERLNKVSRRDAEPEIRSLINSMIEAEAHTTPLSLFERENLIVDVLNELFGLGPLEVLLKDRDISDILVNRFNQVYIERNGRLEETPVIFKDDRHLMQIIERIVSSVGRRIDESSPMVDARLQDGSRVNAIIPPLSIDGPHLSIRKFRKDALSGEDLLRYGSLTPAILEVLSGCVKARLNVLISGGTGAGKTTLLNVLSSFIPSTERIVTIEDSAELQLRQEHVVRLETRPPNIEGEGQITQRQLVINSLRMRPDRIVVGEVRGGEAIDMLQAMNTGHDGSLTTIHANSPRDALARLETMIQMSGIRLSERAMQQQIASAINLVIQIARLSDGVRRITSISEITGIKRKEIVMQEIYRFERLGVDGDGRVVGRFGPTGVRPRFTERLEVCGLTLPQS